MASPFITIDGSPSNNHAPSPIQSQGDDVSASLTNYGTQEAQILSEYQKLTSRRVDLVGDYAGGELFLIEGDSMLLQCFDDDALDFCNGFQLLHAAYNVERLLQHLWQRNCNFKIVFFDTNSHLCIPKQATRSHEPHYLLARAAIIRHLSVSLPKSHPSITIDIFETWKSAEFQQYLRHTSPYFLMVHDGAQSRDAQSNSLPFQEHRVAFRFMILFFITCGYNIALINELQWRDTKIMTTILEPRKRAALINIPSDRLLESPAAVTTNVTEHLMKLESSGVELSDKHLLTVIVIATMINGSAGPFSTQEWTNLCICFLLHTALSSHLPLSARRFESITPTQIQQKFISSLAEKSTAILNDRSWSVAISRKDGVSNMADFFDGRLFLTICRHGTQLENTIENTFGQLRLAVEVLLNSVVDLHPMNKLSSTPFINRLDNSGSKPQNLKTITILPFANKIFDKHLEIIKIKVDTRYYTPQSMEAQKIFQELSHWHNTSKLLVRKGPSAPPDPWLAKKALIRNQRYMAEMQKYAASLTNAVGRSLEPEIIISNSSTVTQKSTKTITLAPNSGPTTGKSSAKKGTGTKTDAKNAKKNAMLAERAADQEKRVTGFKDKVHDSWLTVRKDIDTAADPQRQYERAKTHLASLPSSSRDIVGADCELYMVNCLVSYWSSNKDKDLLHIAALIWHHLFNACDRLELTEANHEFVEKVIDRSGLPKVPSKYRVTPGKGLSFSANLRSVPTLPSHLTHREFLLLYCGPYLERSFDSKADPRVDFYPDAWQRKVLDSIDADRSVFVVAPTSAGKTFISFYAMRKVLEADDDGVLVYVAPTKALVNQIAAEVQARYSKSYKYGGKSVWAIHTRDHRINNANGCQILVTVPHILQIMLLSPSNASWSSRIKRIIFDEIHCIGQAEDGLVWEQLLLMAPSPIIALSATVGNPDEFSDWLTSTQSSIGIRLEVIIHPHRYSDLRKFSYKPAGDFSFTAVSAKQPLSDTGLDNMAQMEYVHPVATLVDRSRGIPDDLALEPRDCLFLWRAMKKVEKAEFQISEDLHPDKALPEMVRKQDVLVWEKRLMKLLRHWLDDHTSPFERLLGELGKTALQSGDTRGNSGFDKKDTTPRPIADNFDPITTTLPLLCQLHERNALPAIFFNYDRHQCEQICKELLRQLSDAEEVQAKSGSKWEKKLERWEEWKKLKEKNLGRQAKETAKSSKRAEKGSDDADKTSKLDTMRDSDTSEDGKWEQFDPTQPLDGYHFADRTKLSTSDLDEIIKQLTRFEINPTLIDALRRGLGVHHAGMNRKYRQVVEMLFRKRYLRVVIATGTLALGINMPCKTVVFSGDSIFLTALNFRQCAGRAGRRGFDLLGNVVFQGVPGQKICRLVSSRLPSLNGHFPITTSFVLRLFILLGESKQSKYAINAVNSVLSQPRLYLGGDSFKHQTMHHLRFSIEYLRRQQLLGLDGTPLNFAGLVSHLYYTENSSFAFHALLKEGFFNNLCSGINVDQDNTLLTLMLVMAHLFGRTPCKRSDKEFIQEVVKKSSSMVFLPPLPEGASKILNAHNQTTQAVFEKYVRTYIDQHITANDDVLPLTGVKVGGNEVIRTLPSLPPTQVRSAFVALSGTDDSFDSIHDLCSTVRSGVFLEEAVIPYIDIGSSIRDAPVNAWLLDFFKHGDVATLERDNGIKRSDVWFMLNDFSLVLATIVTSLTNFLGLDGGGEIDFSLLQGQQDAHDEAKEDEAESIHSSGENVVGQSGLNVKLSEKKIDQPIVTKRARAKVVDSWDDEDEDEESGDGESITNTTDSFRTLDMSTNGSTTPSTHQEDGLHHVLKAFKILQVQFNEQFKAMWA